ncbi:MAG: YggS family pyridoxal phosphate-dependent enzyme [Clostridia bacterium]|nr:YggS family pyridoxal phosphate-dependent enzyme [Clostridia bacterium]
MALSETRQNEIRQGYRRVLETIERASRLRKDAHPVTLVAASKTRSAEEINFAASLGLKVIGENRVQELCDKYDQLSKELEIHFIGALQTNKVKYIIDKVSLIHSVDRLSLAQEIDRQAKKHGKVMDILCEVNLGEAQKSGVSPEELPNLLSDIRKMQNIRLRGLMAVPPISHSYDEQFAISQKFIKIFIDNCTQNIDNRCSMQIISLGMSEDYPAAIAAGSNMVRVGSAIFGARDYTLSH